MTLPFGLVALFWVRAFKPLVLDADFQQQGNPEAGLGFVKGGFNALRDLPATALRPGASFRGRDAENLSSAIREARNTIKKMPAFHTTLPGGTAPVFPCESVRVRDRSEIALDGGFLGAFGTFKVPTPVWDALSQFACWVEPAIISEWASTMRGYERSSGREKPLGDYLDALRWPEHERDTGEVRKMVEAHRGAGKAVYCVWSGRRLRGDFAVDHGLPIARWPNNDLWNLLPAAAAVNSRKGDKLVAAAKLEESRGRILEWWEGAYLAGPQARRFKSEARASLPGLAQLGGEADTGAGLRGASEPAHQDQGQPAARGVGRDMRIGHRYTSSRVV